MANRLKITSLKFISAVDAGAQGPISNIALVKRAPTGDEFTITCKVAKLDDTMGVVFGYALASTVDGGKTPHVDLQDDAILGGDELIKVALGFVEAGAASDVMHDENPDGFVPFVMPLTEDTKKAFKLTGDVDGIAIGMKPSAETFKRFQSGELGAFSIGGTGIREPLTEAKRAPTTGKVAKAALYTDEVDGHQHTITIYDDGCFSTSCAMSSGATSKHSHAVVQGADGSLQILSDSGHTHILADGQPSLVVVAPDDIVVVAARAPAPNSTRSTPAQKVNTMKLVVLTEAQHAHYSKLAPADAEVFLAKTASDRDTEIEKARNADPVIFKGEKTGVEVRKSDGDLALRMAKQSETQAVELAKAQEQIASRDTEIEKADVCKVATETLGGMPGDDETHQFIIASLRKGGDPVKAKKAIEALTAMRETSKLGKKAPGMGGSTDPETGNPVDAMVALEKGLVTFCKAQGIAKNLWTHGLDAFKATPEGAALKAAYDASRAG